jgi:large subunit ribosomal protein L9
MAKSEVILIKNVVGLGGESDQVKVSAGYARNYLIPQGYAVPVTQANKKRLEALRRQREERETQELGLMNELARGMEQVVLSLGVRTGDDGRMFGSVTAGTIVDALKTQMDVSLDRKKVHLEKPIHTLGDHVVELRLHPEVRVDLKIQVKSSNPLPASAPAETAGKART